MDKDPKIIMEKVIVIGNVAIPKDMDRAWEYYPRYARMAEGKLLPPAGYLMKLSLMFSHDTRAKELDEWSLGRKQFLQETVAFHDFYKALSQVSIYKKPSGLCSRHRIPNDPDCDICYPSPQ